MTSSERLVDELGDTVVLGALVGAAFLCLGLFAAVIDSQLGIIQANPLTISPHWIVISGVRVVMWTPGMVVIAIITMPVVMKFALGETI